MKKVKNSALLAILLVLLIFILKNNTIFDYEQILCDSRVPKMQLNNSKEEHLKVNATINIEEVMKNPILINQSDPRLIKVIRDKYLIPPSNDSNERPQKELKDPSQNKIATKWILKFLQNKRGGFFIECGANNGLHFSNTYYMENSMGWSGLLIEGGRTLFETMKKIRTRTWRSNTCLSPHPYPAEVVFHEVRGVGGFDISIDRSKMIKEIKETITKPVQCVPLYSLLLAINRTEIDFFSLDVEGSEMGILKSIPWNLVKIKTLFIEHNLIPDGITAMRRFMTTKGYKIHGKTQFDILFYHPQY